MTFTALFGYSHFGVASGSRRQRADGAENRRSPPTLPMPSDVVWRDGVHLVGTVIWCDAGRARDLMFLSHAHLRSRGAHRKILTSPRTLLLLRARGALAGPAGPVGEVLVTPFGRPFSLGALRLELFPSGHVPGAASLLLTRPDGRRIVYAGDVNPVASLAEPAEVRGADTLVLDAPLAALAGTLPPRGEVLAALARLVEEALGAGRVPVVLAPPLGTAQEALITLAARGLRLRAHPRIYDVAAAYATLGIAVPLPARHAGRLTPGEVLLWPLDLRASNALGTRGRPTTRIALSGLGLDPTAAAALAADHVLPLSDSGDVDALVAYALNTGATDVYLTHGGRLATALGARGIRVHTLGPPHQMNLFGGAVEG